MMRGDNEVRLCSLNAGPRCLAQPRAGDWTARAWYVSLAVPIVIYAHDLFAVAEVKLHETLV